MNLKKKGNMFTHWLRRAKLRIHVCRLILSRPHCVVLYFSEDDMTSLIVNDHITSPGISMSHVGCMEHQACRVIKDVAGMINETDLICARAEFDVAVRESMNMPEPE